MIAYKFLSRGAVGPFSGFRWPTPAGGAPGAWVEATGEVPEHGVHACRPADLPYWIDEELWIAELAGDVQATPHQIVAARGRLLEPIEAWRALARALGDDCAATLRARVDGALAEGGVAEEVAEQLRGYAADAEAQNSLPSCGADLPRRAGYKRTMGRRRCRTCCCVRSRATRV